MEVVSRAREGVASVVAAVRAALDEAVVGPEVAARNRYLALGAGAALLAVGYMYLRKALHLTAEDRASQRRKTKLGVGLQKAHRAFLREVAARYRFGDESKTLRMAIDYANQELDTDHIFTVARVSAAAELLADSEPAIVTLDKESHVEWLVKMQQSKGLASVDQALAIVLEHVMSVQDQATIFEIDRTKTRPVHGEPSIILSIKS